MKTNDNNIYFSNLPLCYNKNDVYLEGLQGNIYRKIDDE